jgi:outer membrane protein OmpA-like peptidoglycan-associated protein
MLKRILLVLAMVTLMTSPVIAGDKDSYDDSQPINSAKIDQQSAKIVLHNLITAKREKAELGAVVYKYDMGNAVRVLMAPNQHVICDSCSKPLHMAAYKEPLVSKLKLKSIDPGPSEVVGTTLVAESVQTVVPDQTVGQIAPQEVKATIMFKLDSSRLDQKANEEILRLTKELKGQKVRVDGYTCQLGTKTHNDKLAKKRAKTVADSLKRHGIKVAQITGEGQCCYFDTKHLELNRRVEVLNDNGAIKEGGK